jgi:hypothetical protein
MATSLWRDLLGAILVDGSDGTGNLIARGVVPIGREKCDRGMVTTLVVISRVVDFLDMTLPP